jgi:subtilisin-like proprotein convertase family protein
MRLKTQILLLLCLSIQLQLTGQTYTSTAGAIIPDDGNPISFPINVTGLVPATIDTTFGLETVCINLTHPWNDDLTIRLIAPDGTTAELTSHNGGDSDDYTNTCFNNYAATYISSSWGPFTGTFKPEVSMGGINNGQVGNGTWQLFLIDTYPFADQGNFLDWSITFGNNPAVPFPFYHSTLPIVVINTQGNGIVNEPKVLVEMGIIDNGAGQINRINDPWNAYNGYAGIETRGNSSQSFPKLSYAFETWDSLENELDLSLLGMPADNDWVLIANYSDKSLMRNYLAYDLFREMGHYATRMKYCDLVIDGEYRGIYLLGEKIKRDNNRVDVAKLDSLDNAGDSLTGGYIFKNDWQQGSNNGGWSSMFPPINNTSNLYYQYHYPEPDNITQPQMDYIKSYVDSFELACASPTYADSLIGYRRFADVSSFIDVMIIAELAKNVDAYWLSTFFYKNKNSQGGKIKAGPIWDYDLSWGNADYNFGYYPGGWHWEEYAQGFDVLPFYWEVMANDTLFQNQMKCRWNELREDVLHIDSIYATIDGVATMIDSAQMLNFQVWPILGTYVWPNPQPIPQDYPGEVQKLKDWVNFRLAWMDANMPGNCPDLPSDEQSAASNMAIFVYPNPFRDEMEISIEALQASTLDIKLIDNRGRMIANWPAQLISSGKFHTTISVHENLAAGLYWLHVTLNGRSEFLKVVKE